MVGEDLFWFELDMYFVWFVEWVYEFDLGDVYELLMKGCVVLWGVDLEMGLGYEGCYWNLVE